MPRDFEHFRPEVWLLFERIVGRFLLVAVNACCESMRERERVVLRRLSQRGHCTDLDEFASQSAMTRSLAPSRRRCHSHRREVMSESGRAVPIRIPRRNGQRGICDGVVQEEAVRIRAGDKPPGESEREQVSS